MRKPVSSAALFDEAELALYEAYANLLDDSRRMEHPIVVMREGKVVKLKPDPLLLREPRAKYAQSKKKP